MEYTFFDFLTGSDDFISGVHVETLTILITIALAISLLIVMWPTSSKRLLKLGRYKRFCVNSFFIFLGLLVYAFYDYSNTKRTMDIIEASDLGEYDLVDSESNLVDSESDEELLEGDYDTDEIEDYSSSNRSESLAYANNIINSSRLIEVLTQSSNQGKKSIYLTDGQIDRIKDIIVEGQMYDQKLDYLAYEAEQENTAREVYCLECADYAYIPIKTTRLDMRLISILRDELFILVPYTLVSTKSKIDNILSDADEYFDEEMYSQIARLEEFINSSPVLSDYEACERFCAP